MGLAHKVGVLLGSRRMRCRNLANAVITLHHTSGSGYPACLLNHSAPNKINKNNKKNNDVEGQL